MGNVIAALAFGACLTLTCVKEYQVVVLRVTTLFDLAACLSLLLVALAVCVRILQEKPLPDRAEERPRDARGRFRR